MKDDQLNGARKAITNETVAEITVHRLPIKLDADEKAAVRSFERRNTASLALKATSSLLHLKCDNKNLLCAIYM